MAPMTSTRLLTAVALALVGVPAVLGARPNVLFIYMANLASKPEHAPHLARLRAKLQKLGTALGDPLAPVVH